MRPLLALASAALAAAQPASWLPGIAAHDILYTPSDVLVPANNMPMIGNGFAATQVMSCDLFVANIFNGYLTSAPSHRARVPAPFVVPAPGWTSDAALNVREATYYRRSYVDPSASPCTVNSTTTCTNAGARTWIEQRWYAHRTLPSLMVLEVEVLTADDAAADYGAQARAGADGTGGGGSSGVASTAGSPFAMVAVAPSACSPSTDIAFQQVPLPGGLPYTAVNGSTLVAEYNTSSLQAVTVLTTAWPANGMLAVAQAGVTYAFFAVIRTSFETAPDDLLAAAQADFAAASAMAANGTLHSTHVAEWEQTIWSSGIETDRPDIAAAVNTSIYALVSSVRTDRIGGISPGGLTAGYNGHTFWDQETWMWPSINGLFPALGEALLTYRVQRLDGARAKAQSYTPPYSGAMFPWESALTGQETCPTWAATGLREIHINGDIAQAVWSFYRSTRNDGIAWLLDTGLPILSGIADFWMSKLAIDNPTAILPGWPTANPAPDGGSQALQCLDVIGPDEYFDHVNNSVWTNVGARLTLTYAAQAAQLVGAAPTVYAGWLNASTRIVIPFNVTWPGVDGGLHPEFDGYDGETIKQADVILLGFPLGLTAFGNNTPAVRANDLDYYAKVTDPGGPAMTWGMFCAGYVAIGDLETAESYLPRSFSNAQPPFLVWTETPTGGTPNFLTGAGGFLQVPLFGYTRLRVNDTAATLNPVLFGNATVSRIRGWSYLGQRIVITTTASDVTLALQPLAGDDELVPPATRVYASRGMVESAPVDASLLSLPRQPLRARSQRGQVALEGRIVAPASLAVVDAAGSSYPLTEAGVTLPLQELAIIAAA